MGKSLLYARSYPVNDKISIRIPTVGEILEDEARYNSIVSCVISTPYDFMVYLDDMGIRFVPSFISIPSGDRHLDSVWRS